MQGIFLAHGPDIKQGHTVDSILNLDIYNFVTYLLQIPPAPNNGSSYLIDYVARDPNKDITFTASSSTITTNGDTTSTDSSDTSSTSTSTTSSSSTSGTTSTSDTADTATETSDDSTPTPQ